MTFNEQDPFGDDPDAGHSQVDALRRQAVRAAGQERPEFSVEGPTWQDRWPCLPNERHTFAPDESVCLCGALRRGVLTDVPFVCLFTPAAQAEEGA